MEKKIFTVSQINRYVKQMLIYDYVLNNLWIQGEISNLKIHNSGHIYFTLKDSTGAISSVMFKSYASLLNYKLKNGESVICKGYISIYEKTGQYQFYIKNIEPAGKGALYLAFEQLKEKLKNEGLFDETIKKKIPFYPKKIGIVTSETGAAIKDIINVSKRRNPTVELILYPVLVQGNDAARTISKAIENFNKRNDIDVLIVGRGGGSIEDLWAFNEEIVAKAIYNSNIPIISAVGHETDFTISDFVADLRAPTPSAAAELAVPSLKDLKDLLNNLSIRINTSVENKLNQLSKKLEVIINHPVFRMPFQRIDQNRQYIDLLIKRLDISNDHIFEKYKALLNKDIEKLQLLSIDNNLNRGYAVIYDENKNPVSSVNQIKENDDLLIKLKDGYIKVNVIEKESNNG